MDYIIQIRRDNAATWTSINPVLAAGELGWELDTKKLKFGDGITTWNSLPYLTFASSILHNDLSGLDGGSNQTGDGYFHLDLEEYTNVQNIKKIAKKFALIFG